MRVHAVLLASGMWHVSLVLAYVTASACYWVDAAGDVLALMACGSVAVQLQVLSLPVFSPLSQQQLVQLPVLESAEVAVVVYRQVSEEVRLAGRSMRGCRCSRCDVWGVLVPAHAFSWPDGAGGGETGGDQGGTGVIQWWGSSHGLCVAGHAA